MERGGGRLGEDDGEIRTGASEIAAHLRLKVAQYGGVYVQLPLQVTTHLALHLVNLPQGEYTLANDAPRLVGVSIVANNLGDGHKHGNEKAVTRQALCGEEASLEAL